LYCFFIYEYKILYLKNVFNIYIRPEQHKLVG